jgi:hypothetical protein
MKLQRGSVALIMISVLIVAGGCEVSKSENPLSPSVAGPIPGVVISPPALVNPAAGAGLKAQQQPVTLTIQNATTTGVRPLYYRVELSSDSSFSHVLYTASKVSPGASGKTSVSLGTALPTDHTYSWRVRAEDGANTGPYSSSTFTILAPVVIDPPVPVAPVGGATVTAPTATLRVSNAHRTGPAGAIRYRFQLAADGGFVSLVGDATVSEGGGQTTKAFGGLTVGARYYWRVQASDPETSSGWSRIESFVVAAAPPPPPPTPGGTCGQTDPLSILRCHRDQYGSHMSASQTVQFLRDSAKDISRAGTAGGPWGLLVKTSGSNCNGYSCDILCLGNGSGQVQRDVLADSEGAQIPVWGGPMSGSAIVVRPCQIP